MEELLVFKFNSLLKVSQIEKPKVCQIEVPPEEYELSARDELLAQVESCER